ncbi:MAG: hypothetical protein WC384_17340 [Prolixibacteraceae bacterium]|jgi:hypothetical protein
MTKNQKDQYYQQSDSTVNQLTAGKESEVPQKRPGISLLPKTIIPEEPDENPDPESPEPDVDDPEKNDPTRIDEPPEIFNIN